MVNKIIAVIPARGGSTRIPHKNIIDFMGKPLIAWTIEPAIESKCFDRVIVSTDDKEIAEVSSRYGVEVPFYRDEYADNLSSCIEASLYSVKQAEEYYGEKYDTVVILQATCPLRSVDDIKNVVEYYYTNGLKCLTTATTYNMNPWWGATLDDSNKPNFVLYSPVQCSSQSKPSMYCPNGSITIVDRYELEKTKNIYNDDLRFYVMDWKNSIDIDEYEDIEMAKIMYNFIKK